MFSIMCVCVCVCLQAHIVFKPNIRQQRKCDNCTDSAVGGLFKVTYDVARDRNAGELQVSTTTRINSLMRRRSTLKYSYKGHCVMF